MLSYRNFIVVEGMCQSGKTTLARRLVTELGQEQGLSVYNHGALTYTRVGQSFAKNVDKMSIAFSTSYFLADLIQDTRQTIIPALCANKLVVQDRYFSSVVTYRNAYGEFTGEYLDIQPVIELYLDLELLIQPQVELFCLPDLSTIHRRMHEAKDTSVHRFYLNNPDFMGLVYSQIEQSALHSNNAIYVNTDSIESIEDAIDIVKAQLSSL